MQTKHRKWQVKSINSKYQISVQNTDLSFSEANQELVNYRVQHNSNILYYICPMEQAS